MLQGRRIGLEPARLVRQFTAADHIGRLLRWHHMQQVEGFSNTSHTALGISHIKPGRSGGTVNLDQSGNVILRVTAPAVLEVEDDGPGIPHEDRERVFERFYRRNQQVAGSGLGLAIVGEICRAHLAHISLHDGVQGGLKVRVSFVPANGR
ncbi:histidine kinase, Classic [Pseudomonas fragi]|uniref:histidine kinase n=1 Tax=Pseudomonas fragi TaxID=296 RepID=A0A449IFV3_PSEFR|nr:histidine kinase, Classic [Pseudomonas fragi]